MRVYARGRLIPVVMWGDLRIWPPHSRPVPMSSLRATANGENLGPGSYLPEGTVVTVPKITWATIGPARVTLHVLRGAEEIELPDRTYTVTEADQGYILLLRERIVNDNGNDTRMIPLGIGGERPPAPIARPATLALTFGDALDFDLRGLFEGTVTEVEPITALPAGLTIRDFSLRGTLTVGAWSLTFRATNPGGSTTSALALSVAARAPAVLPAPEVTALSATSLRVIRATAAAGGGLPIARYDLRWQRVGGPAQVVEDVGVQHDLTGLRDNARHDVSVRAVNNAGTPGPWSEATRARTRAILTQHRAPIMAPLVSLLDTMTAADVLAGYAPGAVKPDGGSVQATVLADGEPIASAATLPTWARITVRETWRHPDADEALTLVTPDALVVAEAVDPSAGPQVVPIAGGFRVLDLGPITPMIATPGAGRITFRVAPDAAFILQE